MTSSRVLSSCARTWSSDVKEERSRADSRVEAALCLALERKPTNCGIETAGGEAKKGALPLRCVAAGIAAVRRRHNCLRPLWKCKAGEQERDEKQTAPLK